MFLKLFVTFLFGFTSTPQFLIKSGIKYFQDRSATSELSQLSDRRQKLYLGRAVFIYLTTPITKPILGIMQQCNKSRLKMNPTKKKKKKRMLTNMLKKTQQQISVRHEWVKCGLRFLAKQTRNTGLT